MARQVIVNVPALKLAGASLTIVTGPPQGSAATACPRVTAVQDDAVTSGGTSSTGGVRSRTVTWALSVALSPPRVTVNVAVFVPSGKPPLAMDWLALVK